MTRSFLRSPEALGRAVALISDKAGIPAAYIEKDFWVTEVLRAAADYEASQSIQIVFKGGTSLSKAHRLIRRFSEDVDLLIITTGKSKSGLDRCLKGIVSAVDAAIGVTGDVDAGSATKGVKRTVSYDYPSQHLGHDGLKSDVSLELGTRGGAVPTEVMSIGSLITELGPSVGIGTDFAEAGEFDLEVLGPVRTLVEKLMILHHAAASNDEAEQIRLVRHYYDIWCLLNDEATMNELTQSWSGAKLAREVEAFTEVAGLNTSPRPFRGFGESPAFVVPSAVAREAYDQRVGALLWPDAHKPTFDECCEAVLHNTEVL